jgi:hypothetical protein
MDTWVHKQRQQGTQTTSMAQAWAAHGFWQEGALQTPAAWLLFKQN